MASLKRTRDIALLVASLSMVMATLLRPDVGVGGGMKSMSELTRRVTIAPTEGGRTTPPPTEAGESGRRRE